jgi:hypothetical protein
MGKDIILKQYLKQYRLGQVGTGTIIHDWFDGGIN